MQNNKEEMNDLAGQPNNIIQGQKSVFIRQN